MVFQTYGEGGNARRLTDSSPGSKVPTARPSVAPEQLAQIASAIGGEAPAPKPAPTVPNNSSVVAALEKIAAILERSNSWSVGEALLRDAIREHESLLAASNHREIKHLEDDDKPVMTILLRGGGEVRGHYRNVHEQNGRILWIVLFDPDTQTVCRVPPDMVGVAVIKRSGESSRSGNDWMHG